MSKEFVDAMQAGNNLEAEAAFKNAVARKVGDNLELKRKEISKTFVSNYTNKEADVNDEDV
tara:strand:- start:287 stop:469 length:183 start_codon:yes stop_codon:yes gene_type:complete